MTIKERNEILCANLKLITYIASSCKINGADLEDLIQDACEKSLQILENYDSSKASLSTYLWPNIVHYLYTNNLDIPERLLKFSSKLQKAVEYLQANSSSVPSDSEIARYLDISTKKLAKYKNQIAQFNYKSLDEPVSSENQEATLSSFIPSDSNQTPEAIFMEKEEIKLIQQAWSTLSEDEKNLISLRNGYKSQNDKKLSLRNLEKTMNISRTTIAQKQKKAESKLKNQFEEFGLSA